MSLFASAFARSALASSRKFSTGLKLIVGMKRRLKTAPASCLIFSIGLPSPSIFDLSDGAGKLTRAMQPSLPSAVQRKPPPSVGDEFVFALAGRFDELRFDLLEPLGLVGDFAVEADGFGDEVLEFRGHWSVDFEVQFLVSALASGHLLRCLRCEGSTPRFLAKRLPLSRLFSNRPQAFSDVLQRPAEVFDSFCETARSKRRFARQMDTSARANIGLLMRSLWRSGHWRAVARMFSANTY